MQLPVDISALLEEATNIDEAKKIPLSVSVYLDETAPADLVAHVRSAFASESPSVRLTISYLGSSAASAYPTDDMTVIVAGTSELVGESAAAIRRAGVPVMVCATQPARVSVIAAGTGKPIPQGDLISPLEPKSTLPETVKNTVGKVVPFLRSKKTSADAFAEAARIDTETALADPIVLTSEAAAALDLHMGRWIATVCREKRLPFAIAFPFVRRPLALEAVSETSFQNAGVGLLPIVPGADMPIMTLNQAKMALQIAAAYGEPMDKERLKEIIAVVGGAFACRSVARGLIEFVPVLGGVIRTGIGYAGTYGMGMAIIEYFEGGQNAAGVTHVVEEVADAAGQVVSGARAKVAEVQQAAESRAS